MSRLIPVLDWVDRDYVSILGHHGSVFSEAASNVSGMRYHVELNSCRSWRSTSAIVYNLIAVAFGTKIF